VSVKERKAYHDDPLTSFLIGIDGDLAVEVIIASKGLDVGVIQLPHRID